MDLSENITCIKCNQLKPRAKKGRNICKDCIQQYDRDFYKLQKERQRSYNRQRKPEDRWAYNLKRWYGISKEDYWRILEEQGGGCAICNSTVSQASRVQRLPVDHNHDTGKVRGILCSPCNIMLGLSRDNIEILKSAVIYLEKNIKEESI